MSLTWGVPMACQVGSAVVLPKTKQNQKQQYYDETFGDIFLNILGGFPSNKDELPLLNFQCKE
jgi:hypothetical protein